MKILTSVFDFKTIMALNIKLHQWVLKKEGGLYNNDVENICVTKESLIKAEQGTITDVHCKSEDALGYGNNEEIKVILEFESLDNDGGFSNDFVETTSTPDPCKTGKPQRVKQATPVVDLCCENKNTPGNQVNNEKIDPKIKFDFGPTDRNGGSLDDSVEVISLTLEDLSKTEKYKKKVQTTSITKQKKIQRRYQEKYTELQDNLDFRRMEKHGTVFCTECDKTINYSDYIRIHGYIHPGMARYKCDKCEICYPKKSLLREHMQLHLKTRDLACDMSNKFLLQRNSEETSFKCDKTFKISSSLARYAMNHLVCIMCGEFFDSQDLLNLHLDIHRCEKSCTCNYCGECFLDTSALNAHKLIHSGRKSFTCEICRSSFNQCYNLVQHMLAHSVGNQNSCKLESI